MPDLQAPVRLHPSMPDWLRDVTRLKLVLPLIFAIGGAAGGLVSFGMRLSDFANRVGVLGSAVGELKGRLESRLPTIDTSLAALEYKMDTSIKERAALWAQIGQNRSDAAAQLEELRKGKEETSNKLSRIEGQLEDVKSALDRLEADERHRSASERSAKIIDIRRSVRRDPDAAAGGAAFRP